MVKNIDPSFAKKQTSSMSFIKDSVYCQTERNQEIFTYLYISYKWLKDQSIVKIFGD